MGLAIKDKQYGQILDAAENRRILYSNEKTGDLVSVNRWNFVKRAWVSLKGYQRSDLTKVVQAVNRKFDPDLTAQILSNDKELDRAREALQLLENRFVKKDSTYSGCFKFRTTILETILDRDIEGNKDENKSSFSLELNEDLDFSKMARAPVNLETCFLGNNKRVI